MSAPTSATPPQTLLRLRTPATNAGPSNPTTPRAAASGLPEHDGTRPAPADRKADEKERETVWGRTPAGQGACSHRRGQGTN